MPMLESVTLTPGGSARMRPMSASARRKPSAPNLLDAIPEVTDILLSRFSVTRQIKHFAYIFLIFVQMATSRNMLVNRNEEIVLPLEDIAEVVASSFDPRFPPKNMFKHTMTHKTNTNTLASEFVLHSSSGGNNENSLGGYSSNHSSSSNLSIIPASQRRMGATSVSYDKNGSEIKGWFSSGTIPQFLHVLFYEKWEIKKVRFTMRFVAFACYYCLY
jgi:hypothetical protein